MILDNLSSDKNDEAARVIAGPGARASRSCLLQPRSQSNRDGIRQTAAASPIQDRRRPLGPIGRTLNLFTSEECANYVRHCGYNPL
jgi:hypothetical protein